VVGDSVQCREEGDCKVCVTSKQDSKRTLHCFFVPSPFCQGHSSDGLSTFLGNSPSHGGGGVLDKAPRDAGSAVCQPLRWH